MGSRRGFVGIGRVWQVHGSGAVHGGGKGIGLKIAWSGWGLCTHVQLDQVRVILIYIVRPLR